MPAMNVSKTPISTPQGTRFPVPTILTDWLEEGDGRAAYFERVDPSLQGPVISRMKTGHAAVTFEYAIRLERAQKASVNPFRAVDIMTFDEDRALYRYVTGVEAAPAQLKAPRRGPAPKNDSASANAGA